MNCMKSLFILWVGSLCLITTLVTSSPILASHQELTQEQNLEGEHHPPHFEKTALDFLKLLDTDQHMKAQMDLNDSSRVAWHFVPGASWPRKGIRMDDLNKNQETLLFDHLKASLSEVGYELVRHIMGLENVLAEIEKRPEYRDPELYSAAFYGHPGTDSIWAWSFEGHHISLHFTIVNDSMAVAPRFFGANPATIPSGERKGERTLAEEEDLGFKMIQSMDSQQKEKAVLKDHTPKDIVSYNISKADPLSPTGLTMKEMTPDQKSTMISILHLYLSMMPDDLAQARMENLRQEELDKIHFAWAGAEAPGKAHYYRIQGKTFLIEFDNTQNNANHIHTVWRDFEGDFGRDLIQDHYKSSDHHH